MAMIAEQSAAPGFSAVTFGVDFDSPAANKACVEPADHAAEVLADIG